MPVKDAGTTTKLHNSACHRQLKSHPFRPLREPAGDAPPGSATLEIVRRPGQYERLEALSARLEAGLARAAAGAGSLPDGQPSGLPYCSNRVGSMLTGFFCPGPVTDYVSALTADRARYGRFSHLMLRRGVYLAPSQFEAAFVSLAHSEADVDCTVRRRRSAFRELARRVGAAGSHPGQPGEGEQPAGQARRPARRR